MVTTKKDAIELEKTLTKILTDKVTISHNRIKELEKIEDVHRKLNGELRKEVYDWKIKAAKADEYKVTIEQQRMVISDLTKDNQRLAREVNDKTDKLRKAGLI
tara:strand:+ start:139 stop:447 length:309 start_codon:yes stop_codon:yes gene_type:complete